MRARSEQQPVIASFSPEEVIILKTAASQLKGVNIMDVPKSGDVYLHPISHRLQLKMMKLW